MDDEIIERFYDDKNELLKALQNDAGELEFASDKLKDDKEVVLTAVKKNGWVRMLCK
jgi:hypothetical protein